MVLAKIVFVLVLSLKLTGGSQKWVDPHSMKRDEGYVMQKGSINRHKNEDAVYGSCDKIICNTDAYYKRIIRLLLNNAHLDKDTNLEYFTGHLNLKLNLKDHNFLIDFSLKDNSTSDDFAYAQSIVETAFQKTLSETFENVVLSIQDRMYLIFFNTTSAVLMATIFMLAICYRLLKANLTWYSIIKFFALLMFVSDFAITYLHLFENEEIENMVDLKMHGTVPPECNPQNMQWGEYFHHLYSVKFSESRCKKYYRDSYRTLSYAVTPYKVLSHQFGTFIIGPLNHLGTGLGGFASSMFGSMPFGLNFILFPIMLVMVFFIVCIFLVFCTNTPVKIRIFPFINFELGQREHAQIDPNRNINENRIEDVPQRLRNRPVGDRKKKSIKKKEDKVMASECQTGHEAKPLFEMIPESIKAVEP